MRKKAKAAAHSENGDGDVGMDTAMTAPIACHPPLPLIGFPAPPPPVHSHPSPPYPNADECALIDAAHSVLKSFLATSLASSAGSSFSDDDEWGSGEEGVLGSGVRVDVLRFHFPFLDCRALKTEVRRRRRRSKKRKHAGRRGESKDDEAFKAERVVNEDTDYAGLSENSNAEESPEASDFPEAEESLPKKSGSPRETETDAKAVGDNPRNMNAMAIPLLSPRLPVHLPLLAAQGSDFTAVQRIDCTATLSPHPRDLRALWDEYEVGINGRKPARHFTAAERGRCKVKYCKRKIAWAAIDRMVKSGRWTAEEAIEEIYKVYGEKSISVLLAAMRVDERKGGDPRLR